MSSAQLTALGKYAIRGVLGKGAMGTVYDGWDPVIDRRVAIKTVRLPDAQDEEAAEGLARFKREAQAAGRLTHPNIVGVFDYGETEDLAYIVMEFVEGRSLKDVMGANERMTTANTIALMEDILAGLTFSHARGVVHRDIKPANIMLTLDDRAKIADFGIARIEASSMTQAGTVLGTPAYMSPEQFMGQVVDRRTDIYSCGVLLYQLLTGDRPFDGSMTAIMHKVLTTVPPRPSELAVTAPANLDGVVAKAMARRPEDRYDDAAAFAQALRAPPAAAADFASDETIVAPRTAAARQAPATPAVTQAEAAKPGSKLPIFVGGGVAALAAAAAVVWFVLPSRETAPAVQQATIAPQLAAPVSQPSIPATVGPAQPPPPSPAPTAVQPALVPSAPVQPSPAPPARVQPAPTQQASNTPPLVPAPVAPAPRPVQPAPTQQASNTPAVAPALVTPAPRPVQPPPVAATSTPVYTPPPSSPQPPTTSQATNNPPAVAAVPLPSSAAPPAPSQPTSASIPPPASPFTATGSAPLPSLAPPTPAPIPPPPEPVRSNPVQPPAAPVRSAAAIEAALANSLPSVKCSLARASVAADGTVTVGGVAGEGQPADALRRAVAASEPAAANWQVQPFDGPYCPALDVLRPLVEAGRERGGMEMGQVGGPASLKDNDVIALRLTMPGFGGYLHVEYLQHDATVAPQVPGAGYPSQTYAAHAQVDLGTPRPDFEGWHVGPPFGTDMIVAVASTAPLFARPLPESQPLAAYLSTLQTAIEALRRRGGSVAATAVVLDTRPAR